MTAIKQLPPLTPILVICGEQVEIAQAGVLARCCDELGHRTPLAFKPSMSKAGRYVGIEYKIEVTEQEWERATI